MKSNDKRIQTKCPLNLKGWTWEMHVYIKKIVVDTNEITIQVDDSYTTFEEREELIGEKMCEVLGLSELEYSVNCTYQFVSSDCSDTWKEEDEE